jgi:hypothetical protein
MKRNDIGSQVAFVVLVVDLIVRQACISHNLATATADGSCACENAGTKSIPLDYYLFNPLECGGPAAALYWGGHATPWSLAFN